VQNIGDVLQRASSIFGPFGMRLIASARIAGTISQPSVPVIPSASGTVEDYLPARILLGDMLANVRSQRRLDAAGFKLRARDGEIGVDDGDVFDQVEALGRRTSSPPGTRTAHKKSGRVACPEIGQRLDRRVLGENHQVGEREAGAEDLQRHAFLI